MGNSRIDVRAELDLEFAERPIVPPRRYAGTAAFHATFIVPLREQQCYQRSGTVMPAERRYPIGAEVRSDGVAFRVWAQDRRRVSVVTDRGEYPLEREANGYFSGVVATAQAG